MAAGSKSRTILVVDDDEVIGNVLTRVLERDGYEVQRATSPGGALELARREAPDIALVDLCYPDGDGVELAGQLRASYGDLPLVLMTAYPVRVRERPELSRVFDRVLSKPINLDELRQALNAALDQRGAVAGSARPGAARTANVEEGAMRPPAPASPKTPETEACG